MGYSGWVRYPWSLWSHSIYDEELNGNYVQLSTIHTQLKNALVVENTDGKDASQLSYFEFRVQQLEETFKKIHCLLFNYKPYNIKYFDGIKYSGQNVKI